MKPNPAQHEHHAHEMYRSGPAANQRVAQINAAGFKAYSVDMRGLGRPVAQSFVVHITNGKHADLSRLPSRKSKGIHVNPERNELAARITRALNNRRRAR